MGSFSIWHWIIVLVVILLLFGRGKIPELMSDVAKGIKGFKRGMADDDTATADATKAIDHRPAEPVQPVHVEPTRVETVRVEPVRTESPRIDPLHDREGAARNVG